MRESTSLGLLREKRGFQCFQEPRAGQHTPAPPPLNAHLQFTKLNPTRNVSRFHRTTHRMGSKAGQAGGLFPSVWFCRKSIMACLTVCSSLSGPAGGTLSRCCPRRARKSRSNECGNTRARQPHTHPWRKAPKHCEPPFPAAGSEPGRAAPGTERGPLWADWLCSGTQSGPPGRLSHKHAPAEHLSNKKVDFEN